MSLFHHTCKPDWPLAVDLQHLLDVLMIATPGIRLIFADKLGVKSRLPSLPTMPTSHLESDGSVTCLVALPLSIRSKKPVIPRLLPLKPLLWVMPRTQMSSKTHHER